MRCVNCNRIEKKEGVRFCRECGKPLINSGVQRLRSGQSLPTVTRRYGMTTQNQIDPTRDMSEELRQIYEEVYRSLEAFQKGTPVWELFGRHKAAYKAEKTARETVDMLVELKRDTFVRMHAQVADAELARRQAELSDAIMRERLPRLVDMYTEYLVYVNQVLGSEEYASLPEEVRESLAMILLKRGEEQIFNSLNQDLIHSLLTGTRDDNESFITGPEEF